MKKALLALFCLTIMFQSCTESSNTAQKELLVGSWIFENGTRNGGTEGIELLQNLIFDFTDKTLTCELLPDMHEGFGKEVAYEFKENNIVVGTKLNMVVKDINQDNLLIKFELMLGDEPTLFDLKFKRQ